MAKDQSEYIERHIEAILNPLLNEFPAVLLTGARQVGKSTLLKYIAPDYDYVTLDDPIALEQASSDPRLFLLNHPGKTIIDEVQYAPELFRMLKLEIDQQGEPGRFLLSGSQAFELMQNISESLAGRVAILTLKGLSLREINRVQFYQPFVPSESYLQARPAYLNSDSDSDVWRQIHLGDMPRLHEKPGRKDHWEIYYSSYIATYIERDVRQLTAIQNSNDFTRFMVAVAARSGELLNFANVAREVGVSAETIKRWVIILQAAGIVFLLPPYSNNHLKRAIKTPKIYFLDTGLMAYLSRWLTPETLQRGAKSGQFFETFVVSQIIKSYTNCGLNPPLYFYRDTHQQEIDLLIEHEQTLYPIEIKTTASPNKKMAKAFSALDGMADIKRGTGVILCQYPDKQYLAEDLLTLPVSWI